MTSETITLNDWVEVTQWGYHSGKIFNRVQQGCLPEYRIINGCVGVEWSASGEWVMEWNISNMEDMGFVVYF